MADYNLVVLVGRLVRDPELKYTAKSGVPYAKMSLAVNRQFSLPDGSVQKSVAFVNVSVWRHQAELCCQFLHKGSLCMASGFLEQLRWTDAAQNKRSALRVRAQRIQFLDRRTAAATAPAMVDTGSAAEPEAESDAPDDE